MPSTLFRLCVRPCLTLLTLLALSAGSLLTSAARAATLQVPSQYATIQAAINAAAVGDTVLLANGTYTGTGNFNLNFGGKNLIVRSQSGDPTQCILDCQQRGSGFNFQNRETAAATVADITIRNGSGGNSGGMYVTNSSPTITHCIFSRNTSSYGGGGMYIDSGNPTLTNCTFSANTGGRYGGGGIFIYEGKPTLTNCTFTGNTAGSGGAGGGMGAQGGNLFLTNCTFFGNAAGDGGAGGMFLVGSYVTVTNCILWGDTNGEIGANYAYSFRATYSDVQGGYAGIGNINADPRFVRTPSPGSDGAWGTSDDDYGDLHLQFGSPCLDAGSNTALSVGITSDMGGSPRISRATVDLGAYEYQNRTPTANAQNRSLNQGGNLPLTLSGSDPENDALTVSVQNGPAHGSLSGTAPNLTYTPTSTYFGADRFTFIVTDAYGAISGSATVSLTVNAIPTPAEVTGQVRIQASGFTAAGGTNYTQTLTLTNTTNSDINGPIYLVLDNLSGAGVQLTNLSGTTIYLAPSGRPYISLTNGIPTQGSLKIVLKFNNPNRVPITDTPRLFAGPGRL